MTAEEHVKLTLGSLIFDNAVLKAQLEEARELATKSGASTEAVRQGAETKKDKS
jgi:hypothetical protein